MAGPLYKDKEGKARTSRVDKIYLLLFEQIISDMISFIQQKKWKLKIYDIYIYNKKET